MRTITDKIDGDLVIDQDTVLNGLVAGSVIVRPAKVLVINGMVTGNVVIEQDANVEMNGIVSGDVFNQGGTFVRIGMLAGNLVDEAQKAR